MKTIYAIFFLFLPFLATAQITFEEVTSTGEFVLELAESEGRQAIKTESAWYTKTLSDKNWSPLPIPIDSILDLKYSPDGRLYILKEDVILTSTNNGQSFTTISLPANLPLVYNLLEVLDNDVLFIYDDGLFFVQYSLDNGQNWIIASLSIGGFSNYSIKKVESNIIASGAELYATADIIDIPSNQTNYALFEDLNFFYYSLPAILDDGTIYFTGHDLQVAHIGALYSFRVDQGFSLVGYFPVLDGIFGGFKASGSDLFAFRKSKYYVFNGQSFDEYPMHGLPDEAQSRIITTENEFVYMTYADRIFRSTTSLTYQHNVTGSVFKDSNNDCSGNADDVGLQHWMVKVEGDNFMRIKSTDVNGNFKFVMPQGNFTLSTQPINANWELCQSQAEIVIDDNHPDSTFNFQAMPLGDCANLEIDFSTPFLRRCFENYYQVRVRNFGPSNSAGTSLTLTLDPFFEFISATIPWTEISPGVFEFELGVLEINEEISFRIQVKITCDAELGQEHCLYGSLEDGNLCDLARYYYNECQENIGSLDPNDKRIFNEAGVETDRVDLDEYIYYHIRFQNTGTDTAFNIRVVDPISAQLDLNTLEMLTASHPYTYEITDGPDLVVRFENILLPDSLTNEPASNGFFKFRIKPLASLDYGTNIPNQASIYFDFNEPVQTVEVTTTLLPTVYTKEISLLNHLKVQPNPAHDFVMLQLSPGEKIGFDTYEIVDQFGRTVVAEQAIDGGPINVEQLNSGMYSLLIQGNGLLVGVGRFIKM